MSPGRASRSLSLRSSVSYDCGTVTSFSYSATADAKVNFFWSTITCQMVAWINTCMVGMEAEVQ
jgi:hypothetical protein